MSILGSLTDEMVAKQLATFDLLRDKPRWKEAYAEWDRLRAPSEEGKKVRRPVWHSFYGGPTSVEALASRFGQLHMYELMYRDWSNRIHVGDLLSGIRGKDGGIEIGGLRQTNNLANWATFAATMGISSSRRMLLFYRPGEITDGSFRRWYQAEVMVNFRGLNPRAADGLFPEER
jgi:hypothetical protein